MRLARWRYLPRRDGGQCGCVRYWPSSFRASAQDAGNAWGWEHFPVSRTGGPASWPGLGVARSGAETRHGPTLVVPGNGTMAMAPTASAAFSARDGGQRGCVRCWPSSFRAPAQDAGNAWGWGHAPVSRTGGPASRSGLGRWAARHGPTLVVPGNGTTAMAPTASAAFSACDGGQRGRVGCWPSSFRAYSARRQECVGMGALPWPAEPADQLRWLNRGQYATKVRWQGAGGVSASGTSVISVLVRARLCSRGRQSLAALVDRARRMLSPSRLMRCALCTRRSRMASA